MKFPYPTNFFFFEEFRCIFISLLQNNVRSSRENKKGSFLPGNLQELREGLSYIQVVTRTFWRTHRVQEEQQQRVEQMLPALPLEVFFPFIKFRRWYCHCQFMRKRGSNI